MVQFPKAENDMLAAEGYIYAGNFAAAQALIDASRAKHGLASIGAITSASQQIQGGINGCVPQVPLAPAFSYRSLRDDPRGDEVGEAHGDGLLRAYCGWFDGRGWGDLVYGMPTMWPVPNEEMDSRQAAVLQLGRSGNPGSAAKGTYGF